jgi:hypothetical protein
VAETPNTKMTKTKLLQTSKSQAATTTATIKRLRNRADRTEGKVSSRAAKKLRAAVAESPDSMPEAWRATTSAMELLIEKVSSGGSKACLLADMDLTRREFGYANASAVERVLIDAIVAARLRLAVIDHGYAEKGFSTETSGFWENLINNAQFRLLRSVESLARVQRLARYSPALQINLATSGGQQVNAITTD